MNQAFETVSVTPVPSMNAQAIQLRHIASGARILHIACPDRENCFCVAVPTPPPDDTGMPHILEHMSLAGSEKFPCKEPFFEMIKRSVATFINALTGNDITYYPVCSTIPADLMNLADVYFDAVFHPLLSQSVFDREAWHLAPEDPNNPLGKLRYDGIVYSEMKGVFSSPEGILERDSIRRLLPDTCHGKESGGNPDAIPNLSLEQLRSFHASHYHPSNAFFVFYGNIPTDSWLDFLSPRLAPYSAITPIPPPVRQLHWDSPRSFSSVYPLPAEEETSEKTYHMLNWLVGDATDIALSARASILEYLLIGNDAAPLKKAVIDSHCGANLLFSGLSSNGLELTFHLAIDGSDPNRLDAFRSVVFDTLSALSQKPFDAADIEAAFQQVIYACNEITSSYAFSTVMNSVTAWCAGLDPASLLDRMPYYEAARREIEADPMLLPNLIRSLFLDNSHRLDVTLAPSHSVEQDQNNALASQLESIRNSLSDNDLSNIAQSAANLEAANARPNSPADLACLPALHTSDIPPTPPAIPTFHSLTSAGKPFVASENLPTNDIIYLALSFDLRGLPENLWPFLSRFSDAVSDFGTKGFDFAATAKRRACCTGSLAADVVSRSSALTPNSFFPSIDFTLKTTSSSLNRALNVLHEAIFELDPYDPSRMSDLLLQGRTFLRSNVVQSARSTTMIHSARFLSLAHHRKNIIDGLPELSLLERLCASSPDAAFSETASKIAQIRDFLLDPRRLTVAYVGPDASRNRVHSQINSWVDSMSPNPVFNNFTDFSSFSPNLNSRAEGLSAALQVSFSAISAPAPHISSPDAIPFIVGSSLVSSDYMLPEIRFKGNAYGAGLHYQPLSSSLSFYTFRDPHVAESYETMMHSAIFVRNVHWSQSEIENAILTSVKQFETPPRPAIALSRILKDEIDGTTHEMKTANYRRLLSLKSDEVREVSIRTLESSLQHASYCVAASENTLRNASAQIPNFSIQPMLPPSSPNE